MFGSKDRAAERVEHSILPVSGSGGCPGDLLSIPPSSTTHISSQEESGDHFGAGFPIGTVSQSSRVEGGGEISPFPELKRSSQGRGWVTGNPFISRIPTQYLVPLPGVRP